MKCKLKIILIVIFTILFITTLNNKAFALGNIIAQGDDFLAAANTNYTINESALQETSRSVYNILFTIAVIIAFAVGMIIGIQFIVGSIDDKAKVKETLVPYVIGVAVIFSAFGIWKIVVNIGNDIAPTPEVRPVEETPAEQPIKETPAEQTVEKATNLIDMVECPECGPDNRNISEYKGAQNGTEQLWQCNNHTPPIVLDHRNIQN